MDSHDELLPGAQGVTPYPPGYQYGALINVILLILLTGFRLINWLFVTLPTIVIGMLSQTFQITLSLSSILIFVAIVTTICFFVVRYKYLTRYSRNSAAKEPIKKLFDIDDISKKKKLLNKASSNYLDQFLSAIQVFGYLEGPVFHELTRNMTTQKVLPDEVLYLDESLGFLIVVEGSMQVYTKISPTKLALNVDDDDSDLRYESNEVLKIGRDKYQLLNEVKSGAPLSSLISTLDLFTSNEYGLPGKLASYSLSAVTPLELSPTPSGENNLPVSETPEIVARPKGTTSTTLAIIPYTAFQRLHRKYPKATSHIVTMVLTRLYKVSMNTIYNYLGLSKDILDCERMLNTHTMETLPSYLSKGVIEQFHQREASSAVQGAPVLPRRSTVNLRSLSRQSSSRYVVLASRSKSTHPGDLLSSVPLSRRSDYYQSHTIQNEAEDLPSIPKTSLRRRASHSSGLRKTPSVLEDLRARGFSNEREETEETSLRTAITEHIFIHLGIAEDDPAIRHCRISSGTSSSSSSMVGISRLSQGSVDSINSPRIDAISSIRAGLMTNGNKIYKTINQQNDESPQPNDIPKKITPNTFRGDFSDFVGVKDDFSRAIQMKYVKPGETIIEENSYHTGIYYVIEGTLEVEQKLNDKFKRIYSVESGGITGYLNCLLGMKSLVRVKASSDAGTIVAHIPSQMFSKLLDKYFFLQLPIAKRLKGLLSKQFLTIDYALEWCHITAGDILSKEGEPANGFHIVLSGRFRVVKSKTHKLAKLQVGNETYDYNDNLIDRGEQKFSSDDFEILGEYGHGESIGEVEVLTASLRKSTLIAVRDSETARIPRALFELLSLQNPSIMVKVSRIVANRLSKNEQEVIMDKPLAMTLADSPYISSNFKTITILPSVSQLPVREFADKLVQALKAIGRNVISLDHASTLTHLGKHAFDESLAELKLSGYFAYLEEKYETIVYTCDTPVKSNWTSTCISQGDCILLLADADDEETAESIGSYERLLIKLKTTARTDLCLIHPEKYVNPGSTSVWLKNRVWVQGHHHIEMEINRTEASLVIKPKIPIISDLAQKIKERANPNIKLKLNEVKGIALASFVKLNKANAHTRQSLNRLTVHKNDFLRLARILSNEAVGLVLGGGGSRGISHVGIVLALEKHGIPIDLVGGTSIGSFVGGLYAMDYNTVSIYGRAKKFATRVSSFWRILTDLTYPVTSYTTGYEFNRGIWKIFGFTEIEDFWLRYFCNSTNITNSTMDIHETGYLWRFIRASMSLAGLLPPITYNGSMLLDGGYLDNLPVLEMKKKGAKYIIAVDVGSVDDRTPMNYGDTLSGFWVLLNRWNPFSKHPNVPNMMDLQLRLAYVASVNALEISKKTPGVMYLRPPIENYATLDFGKYDEIFRVGYAYADELFTKWKETNKLPKIAGMGEQVSKGMPGEQNSLSRRNSI